MTEEAKAVRTKAKTATRETAVKSKHAMTPPRPAHSCERPRLRDLSCEGAARGRAEAPRAPLACERPRLMALWLLALVFGGATAGCVATTPTVPASVQADADYLLNLGLMRGHLLVGHALFALGERAAAQTHSKHPSDELYAGVAGEFAGRGADGFAAQLEAHAGAVASGDEGAVAATYAALKDAIAHSERVVAASPSLAARVIALLLREAAAEYAVGIVDGQLENAHEYQDAYGFTQVALAMARAQHAALDAGDADREVFADIARRIASLGRLWPMLMPPPRLDRDAADIAKTADEIADLALRLRVPARFG